ASLPYREIRPLARARKGPAKRAVQRWKTSPILSAVSTRAQHRIEQDREPPAGDHAKGVGDHVHHLECSVAEPELHEFERHAHGDEADAVGETRPQAVIDLG